MGFFDDYFDPQQYEGGRGMTGLLESVQQQQAYQPGGFAGWSQPGPATNPTEGVPGQQPAVPAPPLAPVSQATPYPAGNIPIPVPRPADLPWTSVPIGNYLMPQYGAPQAPQDGQQDSQKPLDFGDRLSAGFKSWAYTPVGNPFAALANAITGFSSGQFATAPTPRPPDFRLRSLPQDDNTILPAANPAVPTIQTRPIARPLVRRGPAPWR